MARNILKFFGFIFLSLLFFLSGALFFIFNHYTIDFSVLEHHSAGKPTIVLDDTGSEWARFQLDKREPIIFEQIPTHLVNAFIAAEDWRFFSHQGISFKGIARSALINLYHGRIVQGASTITQQLVKLLFFDSRRTFSRKIKEQLYSLVVERQFTKEQILQTYLNHVYFGCGIYGVQAASQRFWGVNASQLTVDQSALLAAIVRCPAQYCPLLCPLSGQQRRNVILRSMLNLGFITKEEYVDAQKISVWVCTQNTDDLAPHLKETLRGYLHDLVGKDALYTGGFTVQSTINKHAQESAQRAFQGHFMNLRANILPNIDGALISVSPYTGHIKALVGGFDFVESKFNRALQARRQLGSAFKPLVYAAAIQTGMNFADTFIDEPFELEQNNGVWAPGNWDNKFHGEITLAYALSRSNNIVSIKTLLEIGAQPVIALAKKCGMQGPFHAYPSLALGCIDSSLLEAVGMFNIFANNGTYIEPHYIEWVKDRWGKKIFKAMPSSCSVLDSRVSSQVSRVLQLGLQRVRNRFSPDQWINSQAISKTGTTNDWRSCWFVGATPELTTALYIGRDDNRPMGENMYPFKTALPIWLAFNHAVPCAKKNFTYDPSLQEVLIDERTGEQLFKKRPGAVKILV